jgi:hypothetical protein
MSEMMMWLGRVGWQEGEMLMGGDSFGNEFLVVGGVEALDEDGVGFWHEDQVEGGLDLENEFFLWDDVERAEF